MNLCTAVTLLLLIPQRQTQTKNIGPPSWELKLRTHTNRDNQLRLWLSKAHTNNQFCWCENLNVVIWSSPDFNFDFREKPTFNESILAKIEPCFGSFWMRSKMSLAALMTNLCSCPIRLSESVVEDLVIFSLLFNLKQRFGIH